MSIYRLVKNQLNLLRDFAKSRDMPIGESDYAEGIIRWSSKATEMMSLDVVIEELALELPSSDHRRSSSVFVWPPLSEEDRKALVAQRQPDREADVIQVITDAPESL